eukprot:GGOE01000708.1.p1 GENE.GGOE01000708.1~~GGOE01000708.1.p1  ORF type:complete len:362 (+),score=65.26 GGOE01000708.1:53-1087(+)
MAARPGSALGRFASRLVLCPVLLLMLLWTVSGLLPTRPPLKPELSFGVITDLQYADLPDGRSFLGFRRYHRASVPRLQRAVDNWTKEPRLQFAIQLGDLVDSHSGNHSGAALRAMLTPLRRLHRPVYHLLGNHDLAVLPRLAICALNAAPAEPGACYGVVTHGTIDVILLDSYDWSVVGWPAHHPNRVEALSWLRARNPNANLNVPPVQRGPSMRFVAFNGGLGPAQLRWLRRALQATEAAGRRAILFCHNLVYPTGEPGQVALLWNYQEVLAAIDESPAAVAVFSGHFHPGGCATNDRGVHFLVLNGTVECASAACFGTVDVYSDRLVVRGFGTEHVLPYRQR